MKKKVYPSPRPSDLIFTEKWKEFIGHITSRDNFSESHLFQLQILCDLYSQYERINKFVAENGVSYTSTTQYGETQKARPEAAQLNTCRKQIVEYTRVLGLTIVKDRKPVIGEDRDRDAWT